MERTVKMQIVFADRPGIVANVATVMAEQSANIVSMEVEVEKDQAILYVEAELGQGLDREKLLDGLRTIANLEKISVIHTLPQERRERRFQVVLDSISDGILAIDEEGRITIINRVAQDILNCDAREVTGRNVADLNLADTAILKCLSGKTYLNVRKDLLTERGRFQFLATARLVRDSRDRTVGAVEIMKDMREIKELANAVTQPVQITFRDMIVVSRVLKEVISFAQKIARTDAVVAIRGESGTGKELFASAIHAESGRKGPFVPINCAALPEALLESELFGYVGGAFSGAKKEGKPGLFEIAHDGTIFLDEIAEMPLPLQAKMLRVLQEHKVRRVGGTREVPVNARIVTATNKNLESMVAQKLFREDLYYRINVFPIHIPPLRERLEEIPPLVEHFLYQINSKLGKKVQFLAAPAREKLLRHRWPGNVRELRNVIERGAILSSSEEIAADRILFAEELGRAMKGIQEPGSGALGTLGSDPLPVLVDRHEKQILVEALGESKSIRKVARLLGVSHTTLLNKMKKHGLSLETSRTVRTA